jgi:hypothetical protein
MTYPARPLLLALALASTTAVAEDGPVRILFGHQSVGANLLEGVRATSPGVHLGPGADGGVELLEFLVGENEQPLGKVAAFEREVRARAASVDVALMKLCYVDFSADTDVEQVFGAYEAAHARLMAAFPRLTLAHVTTPLTIVQGGARAAVKRLLGRAPWGLLENQRREAFNDRLRARYQGQEPLFDLARLESTGPDGARVRHEAGGAATPMLYPGYASDGAHLNAEGQRRLGRAFAEFLQGLRAAAR